MLGRCLTVLKKMVDERRGRERRPQCAADIVARCAQLLPEQKAIVTVEIHRILAERDGAGLFLSAVA
ncbi:hypothetical protein SG09_56570 [Bradyrhizobium ottawaense]|nr:hypothetical protein SG09_56570 [Bradyrhizobium ottawaense]BBO12552.1 hypothetical protein TM102_40220 [Bradyrhizobium sp. TM102]